MISGGADAKAPRREAASCSVACESRGAIFSSSFFTSRSSLQFRCPSLRHNAAAASWPVFSCCSGTRVAVRSSLLTLAKATATDPHYLSEAHDLVDGAKAALRGRNDVLFRDAAVPVAHPPALRPRPAPRRQRAARARRREALSGRREYRAPPAPAVARRRRRAGTRE